MGTLRWLLFGGALLLALVWIAIAAARTDEAHRLASIRAAGAQACVALVVLYGLAGAVWIGWLLLWSIAG